MSYFTLNPFSLRPILKEFSRGNVLVYGQKGSGKDLLFGNVIARRYEPYVSNLNYGYKFQELDLNLLDCGKNTYKDFIKYDLNYYKYPYIWGSDVYISDIGVYLPSQYCNELNRDYKYFPTFFALSRQVADCNVHANSQALVRPWDKIREQSEKYIHCDGCLYIPFFDIVIQKVTIYDMYDTAQRRVKPFKRPRQSRKAFAQNNNQTKNDTELEHQRYVERNGHVKSRILVYHNISKYDTLYFGKVLINGKKENI